MPSTPYQCVYLNYARHFSLKRLLLLLLLLSKAYSQYSSDPFTNMFTLKIYISLTKTKIPVDFLQFNHRVIYNLLEFFSQVDVVLSQVVQLIFELSSLRKQEQEQDF